MKKYFSTFTQVIFLFGILIILNFFFLNIDFLNPKFDFTKEKFFTLSQGTENIIKEIPDVINIKAFISGSLPPEFNETTSLIKDLLKEISLIDTRKVRLEIIDPKNESKEQEEALKYGLEPVRFQVIKQDQFAYQEGFLGVVLIYKDKTEILESVNDISSLEYNLALTIKRLTNSKKPTIGIFTSPEIKDSFSNITEFLNTTYITKNIESLSNIDTDGILVLGSLENTTSEDITGLKTFIDEGKPTFIFADKIKVENGLNGSLSNSTIFNLLSEYGFNLGSSLVVDKSAELASFRAGNSQFFVTYPFWIKALSDNMNKDSNIIKGINTMTFPWSTNIEKNDDISPLISSSKSSWLSPSSLNLNPQQDFTPVSDTKGPLTLIATSKRENINLFVGATSRPFQNQFIQQFQTNALLLLNALDNSLLDQNLLLIRGKQVSTNPIPPIPEIVKTIYKIFFVWIIPITVGIIGFIVIYLRRKRSIIN